MPEKERSYLAGSATAEKHVRTTGSAEQDTEEQDPSKEELRPEAK